MIIIQDYSLPNFSIFVFSVAVHCMYCRLKYVKTTHLNHQNYCLFTQQKCFFILNITAHSS